MVSLSEMSVSPSERSVSRISKGEVGTIREIQPRGRGTHLLAQIVPLWLAGLVWTCLNTIDIRKWTLKVSSNVLHIRFQHTVVKLKMNHAMMNLTYCQTHPHLNPSGFFFWRSLRTCNVDVITMPRHHSKRGLMGKLGGSGWQLHWSLDPWVHDWMFEWQEFNHPCDSGVSVFDRIPAVYCRWFIIP